MLVRCQIFGDLFLFGLVWQYSSIQKNIMKVGSKPRLLTCISNITLSLPSLYFSESKRELNFCNGYLSLLYFWVLLYGRVQLDLLSRYRKVTSIRIVYYSILYNFFQRHISMHQNSPS